MSTSRSTKSSEHRLQLLVNSNDGDDDDNDAVDTDTLLSPRLQEKKPKNKPQERLQSLDTVRGLSMMVMILVNNGPLSPPSWWGHAQWDGLGLADWVMPFFLAIGGTSMSLSMAKQFSKNVSKWEIFKKIVERTIKLFLLGLLVQGIRTQADILPFPYVDLYVLRIMGVLQRISICYFISGVTLLVCPVIPIEKDPSEFPKFKDVFLQVPIKYLSIWVVGLLFMGAFNAITFGLYVPDYREFTSCSARGSLTQTCNAADYLDWVIMGSNHMWEKYHEPEGLITTVSALGSTFFGLYLGLVLYEFESHLWRLGQWLISSILVIATGLILSSVAVPINKKLYSISYCLVTAGGMGMALCLFYLIMDVWGNKYANMVFFPLVFFGMNAIIVFVGDSIFWRIVRFIYYKSPEDNLYDWFNSLYYLPDYEDYVGQHLWAVTKVLFWMIVAYIMYRQNWFFKV